MMMPLQAVAEPPERLQRAWEHLNQEPSLESIQLAALKQHPPESLKSLRTNSRWAHALPSQVKMQVRRQQEDGWRGTLYDDEGWSRRSRRDARLAWRVEAEWQLSKLLYNADMLAIERAADRQRKERRERLKEVTAAYHHRRHLQLDYLLGVQPTLAAYTALWIKIAELTAQLDLATGGLMSRQTLKWWQETGHE